MAVLDILDARGVSMSPEARQRIASCTDMFTLGRWLERALRATHITQVLDGLAQ